jgi:hypothetical protein
MGLVTYSDISGWRTCSKCKEPKPPAAFSSKTSGYCRPCHREYRRAHYVPVTAGAKKRMAVDPVWKAKHDAKTCIACKRPGGEVIFNTLHRHRCADCEKKHIFWCPKHGRVRAWPCKRCVRKGAKAYRAKKKAERAAEAENSVLMVLGDGRCAKCLVRIRQGNNIDRSHRCE